MSHCIPSPKAKKGRFPALSLYVSPRIAVIRLIASPYLLQLAKQYMRWYSRPLFRRRGPLFFLFRLYPHRKPFCPISLGGACFPLTSSLHSVKGFVLCLTIIIYYMFTWISIDILTKCVNMNLLIFYMDTWIFSMVSSMVQQSVLQPVSVCLCQVTKTMSHCIPSPKAKKGRFPALSRFHVLPPFCKRFCTLPYNHNILYVHMNFNRHTPEALLRLPWF